MIHSPFAVWGQTETSLSSLPLITTRNHFNLVNGTLLSGVNETGYTSLNIPGLQIGDCPNEIAIIVHGWGLNDNQARERFDRANLSLHKNNYPFPVAGFSWDSNTTHQEVKAGWTVANLIAKENGPKLAQFILDFMGKCSDSKVRLIAHSLGSRVVLSSLDSLNNNQEWKNKNFTVTSVHLLGAAVDDEEVSKDLLYIVNNPSIVNNTVEWYNIYGIKSSYGNVIEKQVGIFYNLFSPKDRQLLKDYNFNEHDNALGLTGAQRNITKPSNYKETDVQNKIPPFCDSNADHIPDGKSTRGLFIEGEPVTRGESHFGYFGFRNPADNKTIVDDGAMNTVVRDWNSSLASEKKDSPAIEICNTTISK